MSDCPAGRNSTEPRWRVGGGEGASPGALGLVSMPPAPPSTTSSMLADSTGLRVYWSIPVGTCQNKEVREYQHTDRQQIDRSLMNKRRSRQRNDGHTGGATDR